MKDKIKDGIEILFLTIKSFYGAIVVFAYIALLMLLFYHGSFSLFYLFPFGWETEAVEFAELKAATATTWHTNEKMELFACAKIEYSVKGKDYSTLIPMRHGEKTGDILSVRVNKLFPAFCIRTEWLPFDKVDMWLIFCLLLLAVPHTVFKLKSRKKPSLVQITTK